MFEKIRRDKKFQINHHCDYTFAGAGFIRGFRAIET
jgi:hypothetical protein